MCFGVNKPKPFLKGIEMNNVNLSGVLSGLKVFNSNGDKTSATFYIKDSANEEDLPISCYVYDAPDELVALKGEVMVEFSGRLQSRLRKMDQISFPRTQVIVAHYTFKIISR